MAREGEQADSVDTNLRSRLQLFDYCGHLFHTATFSFQYWCNFRYPPISKPAISSARSNRCWLSRIMPDWLRLDTKS